MKPFFAQDPGEWAAEEPVPKIHADRRDSSGGRGTAPIGGDDDRPFIVLTETKFSLRCIPVWIGTLLTGLGSKI